jgi:hypothetical protein
MLEQHLHQSSYAQPIESLKGKCRDFSWSTLTVRFWDWSVRNWDRLLQPVPLSGLPRTTRISPALSLALKCRVLSGSIGTSGWLIGYRL